LVDDLGWQDTSVAFTPEPTLFQARYRTPHLEKLAAQGLRFSNAYASGSVCTPTRSALLTGKNPARTRITDWTLHVDRDFSRAMPPLADPAWTKTGVQPHADLLPEILREQGYQTLFVGKAHFGALGTPGADPLLLGFDQNVAGHAAGAPASYYAKDNFGNDREGPWGVPGLEAYHGRDLFLTEALTLEAEKLVEEAVSNDRPFFLDFAHYAVHTPIMADPRFVKHYLDAGLDAKEAAYASMIEGYDHSLGRILRKLEDLGVAQDTLIVFTSDNGGLSAHGRGSTPSGSGKDTHNAPLRSGKGSGYEGGIRVPLVVAWANAEGAARNGQLPIRQGELDATPMITTDLFVTFARLAGTKAERVYRTRPEGKDLRWLWTGDKPLRARTLAWNYPHKWGPNGDRYEPFVAMRDGDWKILHWYLDDSWELYHLGEDLSERENRMTSEPEVAARMQEQLRAWMQEVDAQRPVEKDSGRPLPIP
ncbi:MAG: sulfatase, partial [Planctomycetota bacterium]